MRHRSGLFGLSLAALLACADDRGSTSSNADSDSGTTTDTSDTDDPTSTTGTEAEADTETETDTAPETGTETETGEPEGCVIRVKPDGNDDLLGLSWLDAKQTLGAALDAAEAIAEPCAIWVAEGTYHPTTDGDREASFVLRPNVWVYGGFAGTELVLEQRDWLANVTILSGDIGIQGDRNDNSQHVVIAADNSRLDGFTITDGYSQGAADRHGVGIRADNVAFVLAHAIVSDNVGGDGGDNEIGSIGGQGGSGVGLFQIGGSLVIEDVVFANNLGGNGGAGTSIGGFGGEGAGAFVRQVSTLEVRGSTFLDNRSGDGGAGMQLGGTGGPGAGLEIIGLGAEVVIVDCLFQGNETGQGGPGSSFDAEDGPSGGLYYVGDGSLTLANSEFIDNTAVYGGGAGLSFYNNPGRSLIVANTIFRANTATSNAGGLLLSADGSGTVTLANVTITDNTALQAGGMQYNGVMPAGQEQTRIVNSIVWGNTADFFPDLWTPKANNADITPIFLDHDDLGGGCVEDPLSSAICGQNSDVDPQFEDPLLDLHLQPSSPLIDAGDATALPPDTADLDADGDVDEPTPIDLEGLARVVGAGVDLGAYELR